jgi:hypothetical protein
MPATRTVTRTTMDVTPAPEFFKYGFNGSEKSTDAVIDPSTITADANGRKIVKGGSVFVKITASGNYGPYAAGAADGRQTPGIAPNVVIISADVDVTDGPWAIGGYYSGCDFDSAKLTLFGLSVAALRTAMPLCVIW